MTERGPQSPLFPCPPPRSQPQGSDFLQTKSQNHDVLTVRQNKNQRVPRGFKQIKAKTKQTPPVSRETTRDFYGLQQVARAAQGVSGLAIIRRTEAGTEEHTEFIPISAGIYSHICTDISVSEVVALPFPVNGSILMVRQHLVASWARTNVLINGIKGV